MYGERQNLAIRMQTCKRTIGLWAIGATLGGEKLNDRNIDQILLSRRLAVCMGGHLEAFHKQGNDHSKAEERANSDVIWHDLSA